MILLPFLFFAVLFLFTFSTTKKLGLSFFMSCIIWALFLLFITEFLSLFYALSRTWVALLWLLATLTVLFLQISLRPVSLGRIKKLIQTFCPKRSYGVSELVMYAVISIIVSIICLTALVSPPNNWDSMTYHMTRILFWVQHKSVAFYPTYNTRHLISPPWAEYVITHYTLLWGEAGVEADRLANMAQFFAMLLSLFGVAFIAKKLGAKRKAQLLSLLFCAALPMGILQASSTQNDYVAAFWFISSLYFLLAYIKRPSHPNVILFSLSVGLAVLTKGTNYVFLLPILLCFAFFSYKNKMLLRAFCLGSILFLSVNIIFYMRNYLVFNAPLLTAHTGVDIQDIRKPLTLFLLGPLKHIALHLQIVFPWRINLWIEAFLKYISEMLDMSLDHANFNQMTFKLPTHNFFHEDNAGNLLAICFIFVSLLILFYPSMGRGKGLKEFHVKNFTKRMSALSALRLYACFLVSSFLLFSILIKWQPWHSRLHLPIFVSFAPLLAIVFAKLKRRIILILCGLLLLSALPHLLLNSSRSLFKKPQELPAFLSKVSLFEHHWPSYSILQTERKKLYFTNRPDLAEEYIRTAQKAKSLQCFQIGLLSGGDHYEYPIALFLKDRIPDL